MYRTRLSRITLLSTFVVMLSIILTACGDNGYADAANQALANYNDASGAAIDQLSKINDDNSIVSDPTWKKDTLKVLDSFQAAGQAFASLPEAPDEFKKADGLMKKVAFEIQTFVDTGKRMVNNEDINEVDALNSQLDKINDLITQIDAAIEEGNNN
jgi:flagellar hook-associated protein FlgK